MDLAASTVALYLADRGLVSLEAIVDSEFMVQDRSRRNHNLEVTLGSATGFFIKQARGQDTALIRTLEREAACYRLAREDTRFCGMAGLIPAFHDYDPRNKILILALMPDAEDLWRHHLRQRRFPAEIGRMQGTLLATFHSLQTLSEVELAQIGIFERQVPWILSVHKSDPRFLHQVSRGNTQLVQILQQYAGFTEALDHLCETWTYRSMIHGDIKWENLVLTSDGMQPALRLIDWEMTDLGDACWDIGAILQAYFAFWIFQLSFQRGRTLGEAIEASPFDQAEMKPALGAFWGTYAQSRQLAEAEARPLLERSMLCAAARIIQTAYEGIQQSAEITPQALCQLQMSMNILSDPATAVNALIGL